MPACKFCFGLFLQTLVFGPLWGQLDVDARESPAARPNVILIMTDDQGYGDLSCHGNPVLKTPQLDRLYRESIRLTNFHVSPFCTPTRAALMTGRYPGRTGAYRTSSGRTMMHPDEKTLGDLFSANGYSTGMIGKWHLGDNAPHRPQDRGFQHVVWHRCGGIGQASDFWGNDYFDDTYERNGQYEKFEGYCTDVWFDEAVGFIERNHRRPFFLYLAPNAPHGPYRVEERWAAPYRSRVKWRGGPEFYGMVANIDFNVGKLRKRLEELELAENTILIFMTDNGTSNGARFGEDRLNSEAVEGFNAGMRGKKSSIYEGGHRVPFFLHWRAGKMVGGRDVPELAAHLDVLPTLQSLCGLQSSSHPVTDGVTLLPVLRNGQQKLDRNHLIIQYHGGAFFRHAPEKWTGSVVLTDRWRLLDGRKLYDLRSDPAQRVDVAENHPRIVQRLRDLYDPFWSSVSPRLRPVRIDIGNPAENPTRLCSQDWYLPNGNPPWNFNTIKKLPRVNGPWMLQVKQAGRYRFVLRQFPPESGKTVQAIRARLAVDDQAFESDVTPGSRGVSFVVKLEAGPCRLETYLFDRQGRSGGAYFTEVSKL